jgi:plasmid stabilization system protein ParE
MDLEFTEAALGDLRSIRAYTLETWGENQEEQYLEGMWARFEEIQGNPGRWRSSPQFSRNFVARRSERLQDKSREMEDAGLGEYTLLKDDMSGAKSWCCAASSSRNSVRNAG